MADREIQARRGFTTKHILFAIFLAGVVGGAGCLWMIEKAQKSASAVLALNSNAAEHLYPGLMSAREPAVALADSILNDSMVAQLAKQAHLSSSTTAVQIGEFRASLELTQGPAQQLVVRFDDAAPAHWATILPSRLLDIGMKPSARTANAVARVLTAWTPSHAAALPSSTQSPSSAAAPASAIKADHSGPASSANPAPALSTESASAAHPLADGLGDVEALLLTADHDLNHLGTATRAGDHYADSRSQSSQQHLLRTQVRVAETRLDQLRAKTATDSMKAHLGAVREAVRWILTAGSPQRYGFNAAGTSTSELRRERAALRHAIGVVQQERQAMERMESAQANVDSANITPAESSRAAAPTAGSLSVAPAVPASGTLTSNSASSPLQERNLSPAGVPDSGPPSGVTNPLTIVRLASAPAAPRVWIPMAAGFFCGLLFLGLAVLSRRHGEYEDGYEDPEISHRFITPAGPLPRSIEPMNTPELSAPEISLPEQPPRRRASFALDWSASESAVSSKSPLPGPGGTLMVDDEESAMKKEARWTNEDNAELVDRLRRSISETSIGRIFERSEDESAGRPPQDTQTDTPRSNRLAG